MGVPAESAPLIPVTRSITSGARGAYGEFGVRLEDHVYSKSSTSRKKAMLRSRSETIRETGVVGIKDFCHSVSAR